MRTVRPPASVRVSEAFAPGHVTAIFSPDLSDRDPRARGSVGAGIVLELGVRATARFRAGGPSSVSVRSRPRASTPISADVARRLIGGRPGRLTVQLEHALPIGQGFGMSAAGALATSLAVGAVLGRTAREVVPVAHLADLFGGGGLGGVAAILGGGLEVRSRSGIPPWGRVRHRPFRRSVWVGVTGPPLPSLSLLRRPEFLERVRQAAAPGLERVERDPTESVLMGEAERFGERLGLAAPPLERMLRDLRDRETRVAQAMFGRSFFAVARTARARRRLVQRLQRRRVAAVELAASSQGARVLSVSAGTAG